MTKDYFLDILNQVVNDINTIGWCGLWDHRKKEFGFFGDNILPFRIITNNKPPKGSYFIDSNGFAPSHTIKGFTEKKYKNEAERIEVVKEWNTEIQRLIDKHKETRHKVNNLELKHLPRAKTEKGIESIKKEIQKLGELIKFPPPTLPYLYPVLMEFIIVIDKRSDIGSTPTVVIDNEILFNLCLLEIAGKTLLSDSVVASWNKTVYEHYKNKTAKKYKTYLEPFIEWFDDDKVGLSIDSPEYKAIPLLYDEQRKKKIIKNEGKETVAPPNMGIKYDNGLTYTQNKYIEYAELVNEYINKNGCAISPALKPVYNEHKKTKLKYLKWKETTLNGNYHKGIKFIESGKKGLILY